MRRSLLPGLWIALSSAAALAVAPLACAPDSSVPPDKGFTSSSSGSAGTSSGSGSGTGGLLFEAGPGCDDPTDSDGDFVANTLELPPDTDTDEDGKADKDDTDSDGDGVPDIDEAVNPLLDPGQFGQMRDDPCDELADSDADGSPDLRDLDSDNDGVSDQQEASYDVGPAKGCRVVPDCDGDGVIDIVELAAGSSPTDPKSLPEDAGLYFVLPYQGDEQTRDFVFSAGVAKADIYFLVDTTASMQPAISSLKASISTKIIPSILNGDLAANPPIPAIPDAWIGVGDVRDVPWGGYGQPGDDIYRNRFVINGAPVAGNVAAPLQNGGSYAAPANVQSILNALTAAGGGDGPEATTQALWIASTSQPYAATGLGTWQPAAPYPAPCSEPGMFAVPCFRPGSLPVFVIVTDAAFHNGPIALNAYNPVTAGGTRSYAEAIDALAGIHAKVIGVPVAGGNPGAARADLEDLAKKTGSLYHDPAFGGSDRPLVPQADVASGEVSNEVVRLVGLLSGSGLHDATTSRTNYDCAGNTDCTGDGKNDPAYHNPTFDLGPDPFDASKLITAIETVESQESPLPYGSLDAKTFYAVRGDAQVTFRVCAKNDTLKPPTLAVLRALIRVETPSGQVLGGEAGIKLVYFVIPEYIPGAN
jgi:hypothetical protein